MDLSEQSLDPPHSPPTKKKKKKTAKKFLYLSEKTTYLTNEKSFHTHFKKLTLGLKEEFFIITGKNNFKNKKYVIFVQKS